MMGMVGFSSAGADGTNPLMASAPSKATRRLVEDEVKIFMADLSLLNVPQVGGYLGRNGGSFLSRFDS
jgi:hypothetical protein